LRQEPPSDSIRLRVVVSDRERRNYVAEGPTASAASRRFESGGPRVIAAAVRLFKILNIAACAKARSWNSEMFRHQYSIITPHF
jgi:hypothetical protein